MDKWKRKRALDEVPDEPPGGSCGCGWTGRFTLTKDNKKQKVYTLYCPVCKRQLVTFTVMKAGV